MNRHYTYGGAIKHRGKHQIIVPDVDKSTVSNIADLVRLAFRLPPKKYILLDEQTAQANILRLAQHYKEDMNDIMSFYTGKENEYMCKEFKDLISVRASRNAKQYALDETYNYLKRYIKL